MTHTNTHPGRPLPDDQAIMRHLAFLLADGIPPGRDLWLMILDAGRHAMPVLTQIDNLPDEPDELMTGNLLTMVRSTIGHVAPGGSAALVVERSGRLALEVPDLAWARALREAANAHDVTLHGPYLAVAGRVRNILDDSSPDG